MSGQLPFGFGVPDPDGKPGQPFDLASLGAALQSLGQLLSSGGPSEGPVQWSVVADQARKAVTAAGDPSVSSTDREGVVEAFRLADVWLDDATTFPALAVPAAAWSRTEWLVATLPQWRSYAEPILERMVAMLASSLSASGDDAGDPTRHASAVDPEALTQALPEHLRSMLPGGVIPPEMAGMLAPMMQMMSQLGSLALTMQVAQAMASVAAEAVSAGDIGIPLTERPACALVPGNISRIAEGLGVSPEDVRLYLALRESAVQRLFAQVPWLRPRLIGAIEEFARGISIEPDQFASLLGEVDPSDPQAIAQALGAGSLQPEQTPEQQAALARLQTLLALVEGWVEDVVSEAAGPRMPSSAALKETMRRRRAAQGPAEKAFAGLVAMELRPKAVREAATVFAAMRVQGSVSQRDGLWSHPDLLPTRADLEDPLGFVASALDAPPDA